MRHPSEIDDLHCEHSDPGDSWVGGEIELAEERPSTALGSDPGQRKWMLLGVAGCGLVTAITVLLLTRDTQEAHAVEQVGSPALEQPAELGAAPVEPVAEPSAIETPAQTSNQPSNQPSSQPSSQPSNKPTLAATSPAVTKAPASAPATVAPASTPSSPPTPKTAPPPPSPAPSSSKPAPSPSKPAASPSAPAPTPATPTPAKPSLPTDESLNDAPASDLPDVEGWDEADDAVEQEEPADEASPAPTSPDAEV